MMSLTWKSDRYPQFPAMQRCCSPNSARLFNFFHLMWTEKRVRNSGERNCKAVFGAFVPYFSLDKHRPSTVFGTPSTPTSAAPSVTAAGNHRNMPTTAHPGGCMWFGLWEKEWRFAVWKQKLSEGWDKKKKGKKERGRELYELLLHS